MRGKDRDVIFFVVLRLVLFYVCVCAPECVQMLMEARGGIGALGTKVKKCEPYDVEQI